MTRLEDAFDHLIAPHPEGDPDAILAAARREATTARSQRRTRYGLATAAVLLAIAALAATVIATRDDTGDHVRTNQGPVATTTPSPTTDPIVTTTTSAATSTTAPPATGGSSYAIASVLGVTLRTGSSPTTDLSISRNPAASAFALGTDAVVYQSAALDSDRTNPPVPPVPDGAIHLWAKNRGTKTVTIDSAVDSEVLLDATTVGGSPHALVALRSGATPDTARERLVLVDLDTQKFQEVVDMAAWESGHLQARLLPDGDVIGLVNGEGHTSVVRWTAGSTHMVWSTEVTTEQKPAVAIRNGRAVLVDSEPGGSEQIRIRSIDLETGQVGAPASVTVLGPDLWCSDWFDEDELSCSRNGSAGAVTELGLWRDLATPTGAVVTASR